jgi:RNA polymerase sigma-70 factor, ECF subfamily
MDIELEAVTRASTAPAQPLDWDAAYRTLLPKVYRYFCYKVGEGQLAEDLTATTFEKAWRRRWRYRRKLGTVSTWIFAIARHVAIDHFRTAKETLALDTALLVDGEAASPEERLAAQDEFLRLAVLVQELSDRERELLALRYGGGLSQREIADLTHLTPSNVGVVLHRTVKRLRELWEEHDEP